MVASQAVRLDRWSTTGVLGQPWAPAASLAACSSAARKFRASCRLTSMCSQGMELTTSASPLAPENCWPRRASKPHSRRRAASSNSPRLPFCLPFARLGFFDKSSTAPQIAQRMPKANEKPPGYKLRNGGRFPGAIGLYLESGIAKISHN